MVMETEFYTLLDVLPTATDDEILKSYRNLARIYHPDRNPDGVDKFQEISEAYKVLSDPDMVNHSKKEFNLPPGVSYHKFVFVRDLVFFFDFLQFAFDRVFQNNLRFQYGRS